MKQLKQPFQIIKIIQQQLSGNNEDLILVLEYSLVQLKLNDMNTFYHAKDKIIDALSIHYPIILFQIALLYQNWCVELYRPRTNTVTYSLNFQSLIKMPYKLYYVKQLLYISDYIQGMIIIDFQNQETSEFANKEAKVISVNEIKGNAQIFYYIPNKLMQFDQFSKKDICLLQNQQVQPFTNVSNVFVKNNIMILYSYKTLYFYQLNPFKEINNYSQLISNRIIDVFEYGLCSEKFLIVQENGQIDLISIQIDKLKSDHYNLVKLDIEGVRLSYRFINEKLVVVSTYGIQMFDQNFVQIYHQELPTGMINLFEFQNNLYAIKQYRNYSQPFVLKDVKNIDKQQTLYSFTKKLDIKQILQIDQFLIIVTINQIFLYLNNKQLQVLNYQSQFLNCMIVDNQYLLLSNDQQLQLYVIQNYTLYLCDQINQNVIQMKSHWQQNQITIFNDNGQIQLYQIDQNKLIFLASSNQYVDLSSYHIDQENLIICRFDCQLNYLKFPFSKEINEKPIKTHQLNSIALLINQNKVTKDYQIICQNGQYYWFDSQLNLKLANSPYGLNNIVQGIQNFESFWLLTILQQRILKYLVIEDFNEYYIPVKENEELFLSNNNELYLLNNLNLAKIKLKDKEIDFLNANLIPNQKNKEQILLLKDNTLLTETSVYKYFQESFEQMVDFRKEQKFIQKADVQGENVVLLFEDGSICILKLYEGGQVNQRIYQIKENYKFQNVKLSKDIIILTFQNEVTIYSLNKFEKLEQFKAIYPNKNVTSDEQILQIQIYTHSETQLILDLLIQYVGIAQIYLRLNKNNGVTAARLQKKIYSPIDTSEHLRMQMVQTEWQLFNIRNEYQVFKLVHHFFDSSLQLVQKQKIMNDYIIDSITLKGEVYYLGVCGALWSLNLD